jgi:hypothetical protein
MSPDTIAVGVLSILGALGGALVGLFGERWVRSRGEVRCEIHWRTGSGASTPEGAEFWDRLLELTFLNRKDVPVTVWTMQVVFYKDDKPLNEGEHPHASFINEQDQTWPVGPVNLPSHVPVTRKLVVELGTPTPGRRLMSSPDPDKLRAVQEADRVEFVARMVGARDISKNLTRWQDTKKCRETVTSPPWWRFW